MSLIFSQLFQKEPSFTPRFINIMSTIDSFFHSHPMYGVQPSGDGWFKAEDDCRYRFMAIDAMGHGLQAHAVTERVTERMHWMTQRSMRMPELPDCVAELHQALLKTESISAQAAVTVVDLSKSFNRITSVAVGNVSGSAITKNKSTTINCHRGMIGGIIPESIGIHEIPVDDDFMLVFTTDGLVHSKALTYLQERLELKRIHELDLEIEVKKIVAQFGSQYDDSSCGIVRSISAADQ